jgi:hypothetical protein
MDVLSCVRSAKNIPVGGMVSNLKLMIYWWVHPFPLCGAPARRRGEDEVEEAKEQEQKGARIQN